MLTHDGDNAPLVTILVPCFQYGRYLTSCLNSVLAQTIIDQISVEIIVINDGSTDETDRVMRKFTDPRIHYVNHADNQGIVYTLTEGLLLARGKYFARIDADDVYKPHFLEKTLPILERYPEVGLVYGDVIHIDEHGTVVQDPTDIISKKRHDGKDFKGCELVEQLGECTIGTAGVIGRTDAWRLGLPFPDWFTWEAPSDWYLNAMVMTQHEVYYLSEILGEYRQHAASMMHATQPDPVEMEETTLGTINKVLGDESLKRRRWWEYRVIYGHAWLACGNRNFQCVLNREARRCYAWTAFYRPDYIFRKQVGRHFVASFLPRTLYEKIKKILKGVS